MAIRLPIAPALGIVTAMDALWMAGAAAVGAGFGWVFPGVQHVLYSEPQYRTQAATGRKLLGLRLFAMSAAAVSLALALRPDFYEVGPALLTAACLLVLVALSSTDFDRRRIPNTLTYPAFAVALALCWAWPDRTVGEMLLGAGAGVVAAMALVGFGVLLGGGGLGLGIGDGKLIILMGAMIGWPGVFPAVVYGILLGGLVAVVMLVRHGRGATFSYGPYLAAGAALALLFPSLR